MVNVLAFTFQILFSYRSLAIITSSSAGLPCVAYCCSSLGQLTSHKKDVPAEDYVITTKDLQENNILRLKTTEINQIKINTVKYASLVSIKKLE